LVLISQMRNDLVLGIDLSTHAVKVVAVSADGELCAVSQSGYERLITAGGVQEQPLEPVWAAACQALHTVLDGLEHRTRIAGLSITHQRGTLIGIDIHGNPLGPAICDSDTRSWDQCRWLEKEVGGNWLYQRTGCPPMPFNGLTKILWWLREQPETGYQVAHWLSVQDWMVWKLSGALHSSPGSALRMGLLDIQQPLSYAGDVLSLTSIVPETLPSLVPFGHPLGTVSSNASNETGLPAGLPIFPAPGDQPAALAGSGALNIQAALANLGTSFLLSFPVDQFVPPLPTGRYTLEVLPGNTYALELGKGAGTNVLDWLRHNLLAVPGLAAFNELEASSPPGANGLYVVPHWWAIHDEQHAGRIEGLRSHHTRADVVRATLESLVYEIRRSWEELEMTGVLLPAQIVVCGGASNDEILCQIIADVLSLPVFRPVTTEASALGAAISAALGLDWFDNLKTAAAHMAHCQKWLQPEPSRAAFYQDAYRNYRMLLF
jgi:sugar (pentulose or hexulose) kinase